MGTVLLALLIVSGVIVALDATHTVRRWRSDRHFRARHPQ